MKILALIGARSNSKSIKNKNIKRFLNKPLIYRIINTAKKSKLINRIIVSTDSTKYAKICNKYGAETPFLRPKKISSDKSIESEFIVHALKWLKKNENYVPDIIVRLMTTSPLQNKKEIEGSIKILINDKKADSVFVVSECKQHPEKALKIVGKKKNLKIVSYIGNSINKAGPSLRQSFSKAYFRSNVFTFRYSNLNKYKNIWGNIIRPLIINNNDSVDIDNQVDFDFAEFLFKKNNNLKYK